ncbi:hypothetical protein ACFCWV_14225 [Streptomyces sp. NPDC056341]|uniref:hypothetical protein n=1 Tax=Streptomyces sp. NPDC056341 TaxID=3345788 RepID=UPI0035D7A2A5
MANLSSADRRRRHPGTASLIGGCGQERELLQAGGDESCQGVGPLLGWRIGTPHKSLPDAFAAHSALRDAADEWGLVGEGGARGQRRVDFWVVSGDRQQRFSPRAAVFVSLPPLSSRVSWAEGGREGGRGPGWEDRVEYIVNIDDAREEQIAAARALLIADGAL